MAVKMKVDFYQVVLPDACPRTFKDICHTASNLVGRHRNATLWDAVFRLHKMTIDDNGLIEGDLVRVKMDVVPVICDLDGKLESINLEDEQGVAEQTAFLFDPNTRILLLQRNRSGVGVNAFTGYFGQKGSVEDPIELRPVIKGKTMQRLARFHEVRKIHVVVAKPVGTKVAQDGGSLGAFLDTMDSLKAPRMEFDLSMGRERSGGMVLGKAMEFIKSAFSRGTSEGTLVKLVVSGKNENEHKEILDILQDRVVFEVEVDPDRERRLRYAVRRDALQKAWTERQDEVQLYGQ